MCPGTRPSRIRFRSPNGAVVVDAVFGSAERISGTAVNGVYRFVMTVPQFSQSGTWTVETVTLVDLINTTRFLTAAQLQAAGLPSSFTVT